MKVSIQNNVESIKLNTKKAHTHLRESLKIYISQGYKIVLRGVTRGRETEKPSQEVVQQFKNIRNP